jgi:hypothetical protein
MTVPQHKAIGDIEDVYDSQQEQEALAPVLEIRYTAMLNAVHELVRSTFPEMENFRLDDSATRRLLRFAADDVVRIDDTTKAAVREMLQRGQELGLSNWEIANGSPKDNFPGIEGLFKETWAGRANLISRNELAIAQIEASHNRYAATGLVDRVQLRDGSSGPNSDDACRNRNGTVVPLSTRPGQLHIACTLVTIPVLRGDPDPPPSNVPPVGR